MPTVSGRIFDNFQTNRKEKYNRDGLGLRFDHNIRSTDSLFFAYSRDKSGRARDNNFPIGSSPTGNDLPSGFGAGNEFGNSRGVRLGETHTFSPTVINDARFGATRVEIIFNKCAGVGENISANLGIPIRMSVVNVAARFCWESKSRFSAGGRISSSSLAMVDHSISPPTTLVCRWSNLGARSSAQDWW